MRYTTTRCPDCGSPLLLGIDEETLLGQLECPECCCDDEQETSTTNLSEVSDATAPQISQSLGERHAN